MSDISIECTGAAGIRIDRQLSGANDSAYLSQGESAPVDQALFTQISTAEAGEPEIRLSNDTDDRNLDIYTVRDGHTARQRSLVPGRERSMTLATADRVFLIPLSIPTQTKPRRKQP